MFTKDSKEVIEIGKTKKFTYLYTFNHDLLSWLVILIIRYFAGGKRLAWVNGLWCEMKEGSWFSKLGICFGHGGLLASGHMGEKGIDTRTEYHEHVHVEFFESSMLRGFISGILSFSLFLIVGHFKMGLVSFLIFWQLGYFFGLGTDWLTALIRGEDVYWGASHEEAAHAQDDHFKEN